MCIMLQTVSAPTRCFNKTGNRYKDRQRTKQSQQEHWMDEYLNFHLCLKILTDKNLFDLI